MPPWHGVLIYSYMRTYIATVYSPFLAKGVPGNVSGPITLEGGCG